MVGSAALSAVEAKPARNISATTTSVIVFIALLRYATARQIEFGLPLRLQLLPTRNNCDRGTLLPEGENRHRLGDGRLFRSNVAPSNASITLFHL